VSSPRCIDCGVAVGGLGHEVGDREIYYDPLQPRTTLLTRHVSCCWLASRNGGNGEVVLARPDTYCCSHPIVLTVALSTRATVSVQLEEGCSDTLKEDCSDALEEDCSGAMAG